MNRHERRRQQKHAAAPATEATLLLQRAASAYRDGRRGEALAAARAALRLLPGRTDVLGFAGMVALDEGLAAEAVGHYRAALALKPDWVEARFKLGAALDAVGDRAGAIAAVRLAVALDPRFAPAHNALGMLLLQDGDSAGAIAAFERAVDLAAGGPPAGSAEAYRNLGIALERAGRPEPALAAFREAVRLMPGWPLPWANLATSAAATGDAALTDMACDRWLALRPGNTEAIALKSLALYERGEHEAAHALLDFDRFVQRRVLAAPAGFADLAAFNAALVAHVLAHPTLKVPPEDDPTYHCPTLMVTEELLAEPKGPVAALEAEIERAVADYVAALPRDAGHPFLAQRPPRWRLTAWSAVLLGEGVLLPHIHLDGYLSGVYYPQIPQEVRDGEGEAGWFELGRPPREQRFGAAPATRAIQPVEGMMLLFPAYMYHRTIPFRSRERRISIAFDVMPLA